MVNLTPYQAGEAATPIFAGALIGYAAARITTLGGLAISGVTGAVFGGVTALVYKLSTPIFNKMFSDDTETQRRESWLKRSIQIIVSTGIGALTTFLACGGGAKAAIAIASGSAIGAASIAIAVTVVAFSVLFAGVLIAQRISQ